MDFWSESGEWQLQTCATSNITHFLLQDNSDAQFRYFRNNIPVLTALAGIFFVLKSLYQRIFVRPDLSKGDSLHRIPFLFLFSIILMLGLHGANILKIFLILTINFGIAKVFGSSRINPLLTWLFNMGVLIAIERNSGYRFASISPALVSLVRPLRTCEGLQMMYRASGQHARLLSSLVHTVQFHNATPRFVQF